MHRRRNQRQGRSKRKDEKTEAGRAFNSSFPLAEAPVGVPLQVSGIDAGMGAQSRLSSMGILPDERVIVLHKENGGPILIEVKGTRVALGQGVSRKIIVQAVTSSYDS